MHRNSMDTTQLPIVPISERSRVIAAASANDAAGHYAASLALIGRALTATPDDPELLLARASTLFAWRRCREARDCCLRAEALGLRSTALYLHLGWSCFGMGNFDEAEASMRKATAIEPGAWQAHFNLAVVLQAQKWLDEAAANYECALEGQHADFDCNIGLGECRLCKGDTAVIGYHFITTI